MTITHTPIGELARLMEDMRINNHVLMDIMMDADDHRDRQKARDALARNMHTVGRCAFYLDEKPSFSWHLVSTPLEWFGDYSHLPRTHEWTIHT